MHTKPMTRREWWATGIALLFHASGLLGMHSPYRDWFIAMTPLNLVLMLFLIWYTQEEKNRAFYGYALLAFITGMAAELTGVNTGLLFGSYQYGDTLGPKAGGVPLLIGAYWFIITWAAATTIGFWWDRARNSRRIPKLFMAIGGGILTTIFDYFMEPAATALGYWTWNTPNGAVPAYNYLCWFFISSLLLWFIARWRPVLGNRFAVTLLIMQGMFFVLLNKWK